MNTSTQSFGTGSREIDKDIFELRTDALAMLLFAGFSTCGALLLVAFLSKSGSPDLTRICTPIVLTAILFGISHQFSRKQHTQIASWILVGAITLGPALDIALNTLNPTTYFFFVLSIIAANLLIGSNATFGVAGGVTAIMVIETSLTQGIRPTIGLIFVPTLVCWLVAVITNVNEHNILDMIYWALDVQQKDTQRAEMFFAQGEQLRQALLDVQHARSRLESLNTELQAAYGKAEQVSAAKSVFLSNMSHELRTPLNVIIGYSNSMLKMPQMFDNVPVHEAHRPYVQLIEENGHYLVGLINDILDLSKIEAGKLELHCETTGLSDIFRGVLATSIGLVKGKPIQLRPDFPDDLPLIWADPIRVRQIILNLMSNAIKFTETGSVTLSARADGDFVRISVADTGIGIPEGALATIFDRFEQAQHDIDRRYGGTGLGLDISKQLAVMHGGQLMVQSVVGQGSTFSFTIPVSKEVVAESAKPFTEMGETAVVFTPSDEPIAEPAIILVVEDEVSMRDLMRRGLEGVGHVVVDTQDGEQAVELAVGLLPSVIILDVRLPGKDGWEVLQCLKDNPETAPIPVIMCTVDGDAQRAINLGARQYLRKPVTVEDVLTGVQEALTLQPVLESEQ